MRQALSFQFLLFLLITKELYLSSVENNSTNFVSLGKLSIHCKFQKHISGGYNVLRPQCNNEKCFGYSYAKCMYQKCQPQYEKCEDVINKKLINIPLQCPPDNFIHIDKIMLLTLSDLTEMSHKLSYRLTQTNINSLCCFHKVYKRERKCFNFVPVKRIEQLNQIAMGSKYNLSVQRNPPHNQICFNSQGEKVGTIDCNISSETNIYGNSCQADFMKVVFRCLKENKNVSDKHLVEIKTDATDTRVKTLKFLAKFLKFDIMIICSSSKHSFTLKITELIHKLLLIL